MRLYGLTVSLVLTVSACGGEVAEDDVAPPGGEEAANTGPSRANASALVGDWTLTHVDAFQTGSTVLLRLSPGGVAEVTPTETRLVYDDEHGDQNVPSVTTLGGAAKCVLADRWRAIGDSRIGLAFRCESGAKEGVFRFDVAPPREPGGQMKLVLESLGGAPWSARDRFLLARR